jgi:hypothetical protein
VEVPLDISVADFIAGEAHRLGEGCELYLGEDRLCGEDRLLDIVARLRARDCVRIVCAKKEESVRPVKREDIVRFNLIVPPRDDFHENIELEDEATIGDAIEYGKRFFEYGRGIRYIIENENDEQINANVKIKDIREPRDLFLREGLCYAIESRLEHFAAQDLLVSSRREYRIADAKNDIGRCEICGREGIVYADEHIIKRNDYLLAIPCESVIILEIKYLNEERERIRFDGETSFGSVRLSLEDKERTSGFIVSDVHGEFIGSERQVKSIEGPIRCHVMTEYKVIGDENAGGGKVRFEVDGMKYVVMVGKGGRVGDATGVIGKEFGVEASEVTLLLEGRALNEAMVIERLRARDDIFGVYIRSHQGFLIQSAIGMTWGMTMPRDDT